LTVCELPRSRIIDGNQHAVLVWDVFPLSPGHALVIPKRHVASFFQISEEERQVMFDLLNRAH
jgi:diadenosine tetraphosphate (Ap4A) HIT family hydrolase